MKIALLMLALGFTAPVLASPSTVSRPQGPAPRLVVAVVSGPGLAKLATEAGQALGLQLSASFVDWSGYLKERGAGCAQDLNCALAAPGVSESPRLVLLRLNPLAAGRLSVDVRLIDIRTQKVLGRSASVREPGELAAWLETVATRLLTQASPYARTPAPSPYALPPPASPLPRDEALKRPSAPER